MQRAMISLTTEQARRLRRTAEARGVSMAAVIRDAIDEIPEAPMTDREYLVHRALAVIGKYHSGLQDVAEEHDKYFVESILG
ncbi:MAG: ribbon-helix-helix protein, CopG family [Candidatus Limnocylindrales bacterium]